MHAVSLYEGNIPGEKIQMSPLHRKLLIASLIIFWGAMFVLHPALYSNVNYQLGSGDGARVEIPKANWISGADKQDTSEGAFRRKDDNDIKLYIRFRSAAAATAESAAGEAEQFCVFQKKRILQSHHPAENMERESWEFCAEGREELLNLPPAAGQRWIEVVRISLVRDTIVRLVACAPLSDTDGIPSTEQQARKLSRSLDEVMIY